MARVWLTDPQTAVSAILVVIIWVYFGYHCVIHSAGLNSLQAVAMILTSLPMVILYLRFNRLIIQGMVEGAVKG